MAWTAPRTWVTGEIVTAALMNTHVRDNERYLKGLDGSLLIQDSVQVSGSLGVTGTASYIYVSALTTAQRDALSGANGFIIYNSTTGKVNKYEAGTWREDMAYGGTLTYLMVPSQAIGDIFYADTATSIARLPTGAAGQYLKGGATPSWLSGVGMDNLAAGKTPVATGWVTAPGTLGSLTDENFLTWAGTGLGTGTAETNGLNQVQIDLGTAYLITAIYTKIGIWSSGAAADCAVRVGTAGDLTDSTVGTAEVLGTAEVTKTLLLSTLAPIRYITYRVWEGGLPVGTSSFKGYDVLVYGKAIAL